MDSLKPVYFLFVGCWVDSEMSKVRQPFIKNMHQRFVLLTKEWNPEYKAGSLSTYLIQHGIEHMFEIKDTKGEEIDGTFYEPELQKTEQETFRIEKVLRRRINKKTGEKEIYVKWKGYNKNFNQWIPQGNVEK